MLDRAINLRLPSHGAHRGLADLLMVALVVATMILLAAAAFAIGQVGAWSAAIAAAVVIGLLARNRPQVLVMAALPATILTGSAIVPFEGRYIPAMVVFGATAFALANQWRALAKAAMGLPRDLVVAVGAYLCWAIPVTIASSSPATGSQYFVGMVASLAIAFVATPYVLSTEVLRRQLLACVALLGLAFVGAGVVFFLARGIDVYGKALGLYFIVELTLLGKATGLVLPQNYGPFVGPSTEILAFASTAALYLGLTSPTRVRFWWLAVVLICVISLVAAFSREGILMAGIGAGVVFVGLLRAGRFSLAAMLTATALVALFVGGSTGLVGIAGRLDLVADWYGSRGVAILMNPAVAERGDESNGTDVIVAPGGAPSGSGGPAGGPAAASPPPAASPGGPAAASPLPAAFPAVVDLKTASSFQARISLWRAAVAATLVRPIFGYGLGSNADAISPYLVGDDARLRGATTHSTPMRVLVEMGFPGLLIYSVVCLVAARLALARFLKVRPSVRLVMVGCVAAVLFHQLIGTILLGGLSYGSYFFAIALGLVAWPLTDVSPEATLGAWSES